MYEFTSFKKSDNINIESFMKFPREIMTRKEYKELTPSAMLLYTLLVDRLELSFKQIEKNSKVNFYDEKGNMYVIFKRDEIQEKLHLKRSGIDNAIALLKKHNLIQEKKQGKNLPNIIYLGKTIGMIEQEKIISFRDVQKQHSGMQKNDSPDYRKTALHNNKKNINNNNIYNTGVNKKANCEQRHYDNLDFLYANKWN